MLITTDDLLRDPLRLEAYPWWLCVAATGFFFLVDFVYFAANVVKVIDGGWFPVVIGAVMFLLLMTWKRGRRLMTRNGCVRTPSTWKKSFLEAVFISPPARVQGTAVFLVAEQHAQRAAVQPQSTTKIAARPTCSSPCCTTARSRRVGFEKRVELESLGNDCWQVTLHFGFKNDPDVPEAPAAAAAACSSTT